MFFWSESIVIGENIRTAREMCGYSQQEIADYLGIKRPTYSYYETGHSQLQIEHLLKLAKAFGTTCEDLISEKPDIFCDSGAKKDDLNADELPGIGGLTAGERELLLLIRKHNLLETTRDFVAIVSGEDAERTLGDFL